MNLAFKKSNMNIYHKCDTLHTTMQVGTDVKKIMLKNESIYTNQKKAYAAKNLTNNMREVMITSDVTHLTYRNVFQHNVWILVYHCTKGSYGDIIYQFTPAPLIMWCATCCKREKEEEETQLQHAFPKGLFLFLVMSYLFCSATHAQGRITTPMFICHANCASHSNSLPQIHTQWTVTSSVM